MSMSVEKKVPEIRFEGFSGEALSKKLKEFVISNTYGPRFNANDYDCNGNVKTIRGTDISLDGSVLYNQVPRASLNINFIKEHILEDGDLVMITTADCGLTGLFEKQNDKYICSAYAVKITFNKVLVSPLYFKYFFQTRLAKTEINKFIRKATVANLPASAILKITHRLPCKPEQTSIGNTFQKLDSLIKQQQQKHDQLSNIKKAMLAKMFPKQGETIPEIRFKGFSGEWDNLVLGENARFTKGQGYSKGDLVKSGTPIILYGRLYTKFQTVITEVDTFVTEGIKSIKSTGGEVIVPASGESPEDISRASVVSEPNVILGGDLNIIYPNKKIDSIFLSLAISNGRLKKELSSKAQGKSVVHIRNSDLENLHLILPSEKEQTKIGNYFQKLDTLIKQQQNQITKLNHIKQACLSKMFV